MIDEQIKDKIFGITSYCNTKEKLDVLIDNIQLIRKKFPEFKIAHQSNYPLSEDVQRMTDMYFYEDLNHIDSNKWIYYWNIIMNPDLTHPYFNKKFYYSILDTGFSVFQQIKKLTKYLIEYKQVILINYDTIVEDIKIEDYDMEYDLITHFFPGQKAYSLIIMAFNPQIFYEKVAKKFTYENWVKPERKDQLNEERFFDMVHESGIKIFGHNYKVYDKILNEPDYLNPNAPQNPFFTNYLLYHHENILEIYLWGLSVNMKDVILRIDGSLHYLMNQNKMGAFEGMIDLGNFNPIETISLHYNEIDIPLKIKDGYSTRSI